MNDPKETALDLWNKFISATTEEEKKKCLKMMQDFAYGNVDDIIETFDGEEVR